MQRWEHRITARNLRLAHRFLNLELHILLHLRVIETAVVWGVLLEKEISTEPVGVEKEVMGEREQCSMLIDAVKLVDGQSGSFPPLYGLSLSRASITSGRMRFMIPVLRDS